jgi:hypothetical protein
MDAAVLDRFLDSLQATGVPAGDLPALREAARAIVRAAGGAPVRPVHVDDALRHARWQGADAATLAAIRQAGERLVAWQRETAPPSRPGIPEATEAAPAEPTAAAAEPAPEPEPFRWTATAVQVCLAVAILVAISRVASVEPPTIRKSPAQIEIDELVRRDREATVAAAERAPTEPPPVLPRKEHQPAAMEAYRAGQQALGAGRLEEARQEFTRAVAFEPDFREAYWELAGVDLQLARNAARNGDRSEAIRYFQDTIADRRRANQLATAGAPATPSCRTPTDHTLAQLERLERDDTAALAWLGYRTVRPAPSHRGTRYADGGYRAPAYEPRLPGPTRVQPSIVRPTRVRPTVVRPSDVQPSFLND